jgi:outer membrane protein TolC
MPRHDTINRDCFRGRILIRMLSYLRTRRTSSRSASGSLCRLAAMSCAVSSCLVPLATAQVSISTAVDLALRSNPRVQSAQSEVDRARAAVSEMHDVYIPAVSAGAGLGQAYGYSQNPPTLATISGTALVYNGSQLSYIRAARASLQAAELSLQDMRAAVAQDTALAFIALDHDQQREQAIQLQGGYADKLVTIVQQRLDAGQDTQMGLTQSKLTAAQLKLAMLRAQDEIEIDREHLAHLIGLPATSLHTDESFPTAPMSLDGGGTAAVNGYANAAVAAAFASADARRQQAKGDTSFRFRPQVNLFVQYNRYATFASSFKELEKIYTNSAGKPLLTANEGFFGVQISVPLLDRARAAKGRESLAEAAKALHAAQNAQNEALDGRSRLRHSIAELQAQADVASLQQQLAQQQLDVLRVQLQAGTGSANGTQMTPKDEQTALIGERDKYLAVLDANYQLRQAEIQLMRQNGDLETWLKSAALAPQNNLPQSPTPKP